MDHFIKHSICKFHQYKIEFKITLISQEEHKLFPLQNYDSHCKIKEFVPIYSLFIFFILYSKESMESESLSTNPTNQEHQKTEGTHNPSDGPHQSKEKQIHRGIYIADERKKSKSGFVKCQSLDKKIEINLRRDDAPIIHQTEVEWVQISQYSKKQRRQNKKISKKKQKQLKYKEKNEVKQEKPKIKYKIKEQEPTKFQPKYVEKNEKVQVQQQPEKVPQNQPEEQSITQQMQKLNIDDNALKKENTEKNIQEEQDQGERQESDNSDSQVDQQENVGGEQIEKKQEKKKEEDDIQIVGKVTNRVKCIYWQKQFVGIMKFSQIYKKNKKYQPKGQKKGYVEQILDDFYLDVEPIHPRLPYFQVQANKSTISIIQKYVQSTMEFKPNEKGGKIRNRILDELESVYCLVSYSKQRKGQLYCNLIKIIGKTKTINGECDCFLYQHQLNDFEHNEEEGEQKQQFGLNVGALHKKYDDLVFTIDPPTSTDLDDALSIKKITESQYEIGIHIADVSSYLQFINRQQILKRTTSVYLPHKTFHMLPKNLVEICSLNPNKERLAFSIYIRMNLEGQVVGESRLQKNILKSRYKLSYDQVQNILTAKTSYQQFSKQHSCTIEEFNVLIEKLSMLAKVGIAHRDKRILFDVFENREIKFELDEEKWPVTFSMENRFTAQKLVQQFMILGNMEAAKKLVTFSPQNALIIHHPKPSAYAIKTFNEYFNFPDLQFKFNNVKELQADLLKVQKSEDIPQSTKLLCYFKARRVQEAAGYKTYSSIPEINENEGQRPEIHFALGLQYYTHFTSPMRRIGDILVHETLSRYLESNTIKQINQEQILRANWGRTGTKRLKKDLNDIFLCLFIYHQKKTIECEGIIASFGGKSVSIFIPMLDMMREVYWNDMKIHKAIRNKETDEIEVIVYYDKKDQKRDIIWKIKKCETVKLWIGCTNDPPLRLKLDMQVEGNKKKVKITSRQ